jgi:hypothetical protein
MKKILAIASIVLALAVIGCTKTKKEVDWVSTILLYILNKPTSPGDRCNVTLSTNTVFCKQYRSGYVMTEENPKCVAILNSYGLQPNSNNPIGNNMACSTEGLFGSCEVREGTDKSKSGELYFYAAGGWTEATAQAVCKSVEDGSTFKAK